MKPVAVFDIDGTIFRSSLTIELLKKLVAKGIFQPSLMRQVWRSEKKWLNRSGHYEDYVKDVVRAYQRAIVGKKRLEIVKTSREVITEQKFRTYRYTRHLLEKIRKTHLTIGISGSPLEVVNEYNKFLRFDKIYGWEFGLDKKGRYTNVVLHAPPEYKKELIIRYVNSHNLSLRSSIGVGDTESDIGFLELVERPICFNPNAGLASVAKKNNWKIVIERKDIAVEFSPKKVNILRP